MRRDRARGRAVAGRLMFDLDHPFFKPLWVRIAVAGVALGWAVVEAVAGSPLWGILFGALGAYAAYRFFWTFNPRDEP